MHLYCALFLFKITVNYLRYLNSHKIFQLKHDSLFHSCYLNVAFLIRSSFEVLEEVSRITSKVPSVVLPVVIMYNCKFWIKIYTYTHTHISAMFHVKLNSIYNFGIRKRAMNGILTTNELEFVYFFTILWTYFCLLLMGSTTLGEGQGETHWSCSLHVHMDSRNTTEKKPVTAVRKLCFNIMHIFSPRDWSEVLIKLKKQIN